MKPMLPEKQNMNVGINTVRGFRPADIGITSPHLDKLGGKSNSPAAKQVRKLNRAGIVGRKIKVGSGKY